jgi:branched-chain amino acid transport system permease protein
MPFYLIDPFVGNDFMLRAFVISVIGGFGSVPGALIAGLMVGLIEAAGNLLITSSLANVLVFALLIMTLLFRPWGLFGRAST